MLRETPGQRSRWIAPRGRIDDLLQRRHEPGILLSDRLATAALAPDATRLDRLAVEIVLAAIDGGAGEPGDARDDLQPTVSGSPHLGRREQALTALVKIAPHRLPAILNAVLVDHATGLRLFARIGNPPAPSHTVARPLIAIQL
jgi:hypothetical protein